MKIPDTIIISSPRSGLNWVRYCIEWFSRCRTPGGRRPIPEELLLSNSFIICRTHLAESKVRYLRSFLVGLNDSDGKPRFKKVILILRNYKELYSREILSKDGIAKKFFDAQTLNSDIPLSVCKKIMQRYASNIKAYDKFPGEKIHIYYEDLITDFSHMLKILDFIGIDYDLSDFDLEEHRLKSIRAYSLNRDNIKAQTHTANDLFNFTFHSDKRLGDKHKKTLDFIFQKKLSILYEKYLIRYKEENLKGQSNV